MICVAAWNWQRRINAARGSGDHAALATASAGALPAAIAAFEFGDDFPIVWPHIVAASLDAGALDQAAEQIDQIATAPRGLVPPLLRAQLHRFQGLLAAARGEDPEAALRAGIEALDAFGAKPDAARTRQALAEWLTAQGREDEAAELLAAALRGLRGDRRRRVDRRDLRTPGRDRGCRQGGGVSNSHLSQPALI